MRSLLIGIEGAGKVAREQHIPAIRESHAFKLAACAHCSVPVEDVPNFATLEELLSARSRQHPCQTKGILCGGMAPALRPTGATGARASRAVAILHKLGFANARALAGGLKAWREANLPVEKSA